MGIGRVKGECFRQKCQEKLKGCIRELRAERNGLKVEFLTEASYTRC